MAGKSKRAVRTPLQHRSITYQDSSGRILNSRDKKTLLRICRAMARQLFEEARFLSLDEIEAKLTNLPLNDRGVPELEVHIAYQEELYRQFIRLPVAERASVLSGHKGKLIFEFDRSSTLEKDGVAWGWRIGRAPDGSLSMMPQNQTHLTNAEIAGTIKRIAMLKLKR